MKVKCWCSGCIIHRWYDLKKPRPPKPKTVRGYGCTCKRCVDNRVRRVLWENKRGNILDQKTKTA